MKTREALLLRSTLIALFVLSAVLVFNTIRLTKQVQLESKKVDSFFVMPASEVVVSSVGHQIRLARTARGMTQLQLASHVGLSEQNVITIERGQAVPTRDIIFEIEKILGFELLMDM